MKEVIIGIHARLVKDGGRDIDLLVHRHYLRQPSPCVVVEDWADRRGIGGSIESVQEVFDAEVATHPGYVVKDRANLVMMDVETETTDPRDETVLSKRAGTTS